jgi:precorrin-2 dehydrogenase/sirohydrochlorin ferrochelatase
MSQYYPVFLKVQDKVCLVAGGGSVAARKVK